ncbi:MAG: folylpolyglutamate synthase/dihydrofolate synthase family protein [Desulfopila sp.]
MNFQEAQHYLDDLQQHKLKLGLEAMENFLDTVSRPDKKLDFVHVAGTNGKGSVSVNIVTMLAHAGYRVGLFTSPHLSSVRERFRINGDYISEEHFAEYATQVREALGKEKITYFEFTTALALLWFADAAVDLVVLETGLGGRLDATNVVVPLISIITNVSMDHEVYLGYDLRSIAFEKAGIIKSGVPLITGVADDDSRVVVEERCGALDVPMFLYGRDFYADEGNVSWSWHSCSEQLQPRYYADLRCGMKGDYQRHNSSLAVAAIALLQGHGFTVSEDAVRDGLRHVHWPGRLENIVLDRQTRIRRAEDQSEGDVLRYIIDGAHNPAGVASLVSTLEREYSYDRLIVVWGAMEDKDLRLTVPPVAELASLMIITKPQGERAAAPEMLKEILPQHHRQQCHIIADVHRALDFAEQQAGCDDLIVIAGSLYLIGEIRFLLVGELV